MYKFFSTTTITIASAFFGAFGGGYYQAKHDDNVRLINEAQQAAKETAKLLFESKRNLEELHKAALEEDWGTLSKKEWSQYRSFSREWREKLIINDFDLRRYFGINIANYVIHVDQIDIKPRPSNLSSPNPCAYIGAPADYDLFQQADQIDCYIRRRSIYNDIKKEESSSDFFKTLEEERSLDDLIYKNISEYEKNIVRFIRAAEDMKSNLGAPVVVTKS
ncbi:hypothetical protein [Chromobacterium amazonense]|uniref:hypothetical protein n=1 Tax=Chromobacterium amazonense TaxID=1382803 RepID=UPI003F78E530